MKAILLASAALVSLTAAAPAIHASAKWVPEGTTIAPGQPLRSVIVMTIDEGWHTYWTNPGVGGLPLSIKAELPEGWSIGEIQYPAPKRFMTGELPGFGYEGEIHFPITLTPPADAKGEIPALTATLSWLTCDDATCLPGKAGITPGKPDADLVAEAFEKLPSPVPGAKLTATASGDSVEITLDLPAGSEIDPAACEIFPSTRNIIDPAAKPVFVKSGASWKFSAPKSEYLEGKIEALTLILVSPDKKAWELSTVK